MIVAVTKLPDCLFVEDVFIPELFCCSRMGASRVSEAVFAYIATVCLKAMLNTPVFCF